MVSKEDILELVPHYVVMVVLVLSVMTVVRLVVDDLHVLIEFAIILALVFAYRPLVVRIDAIPTPSIWKTLEKE